MGIDLGVAEGITNPLLELEDELELLVELELLDELDDEELLELLDVELAGFDPPQALIVKAAVIDRMSLNVLFIGCLIIFVCLRCWDLRTRCSQNTHC